MEERSNEEYGKTIDDSRRSFMKKSALASGALALGIGGTGSAVAEASLQEEADQALVFTYDYQPNTSFDVITRLQQSVVDDVLGREFDDDPVVDDPSDYNGYVILYQMNDEDPGEYAMVFTDDATLSVDDSYEFSSDAVFFSTDANLLEAELA